MSLSGLDSGLRIVTNPSESPHDVTHFCQSPLFFLLMPHPRELHSAKSLPRHPPSTPCFSLLSLRHFGHLVSSSSHHFPRIRRTDETAVARAVARGHSTSWRGLHAVTRGVTLSAIGTTVPTGHREKHRGIDRERWVEVLGVAPVPKERGLDKRRAHGGPAGSFRRGGN